MTAHAQTSAAAPLADKALRAVGAGWFVVALAGQALFAAYVAAFYGGAAMAGDFEKWNDILVGGYVRGGLFGNIMLAAHLALAVTITLGGPLQLIPALRNRFRSFHRWNGRIYLITAMIMSLGGIYMVWTRGTAGGDSLRIGISLNGLLLVACAMLAWRAALSRQFESHRRWALRTFILVSGVWFFRIGLMFWVLANRGPVGVGADFDGPFVRFWAFGCYLVPLAVLELYFRAQDANSKAAKHAMTAGLAALVLVTAAGIAGAALFMWAPRLV
jgi:hypothetical protein